MNKEQRTDANNTSAAGSAVPRPCPQEATITCAPPALEGQKAPSTGASDTTPELLLASSGTFSHADTFAGQAFLPSPPALVGYAIERELGRGGMGVVYQANDLRLKRRVALKMILAGGHAGEHELARFKTEAEAVARLQHAHIVQIYEIGEHQGLPYFCLEYCPGGSLDRKLTGTPLSPREAAGLVEKLARAMQAAHQKGVIHRDLKPANVLLAEDGTPKITDFGLARKLDEAGQTASGAIMGTPSYMAPEQARGEGRTIGPACDVYALGAILYECLTGRPPFKAATLLDTIQQVVQDEPVAPTQLQSKTPRDLETIALKCLHKEPARRYASAEALAEDLRRFQANEPILARPVGRLERAAKWVRRRPAAAALLGVSVVAVLALVVLAVSLQYSSRLSTAYESEAGARAEAERASDLAEANRHKAEQAAGAEKLQRQRAETAQAAAEAARKQAEAAAKAEEAERKKAQAAHGIARAALARADRATYHHTVSLAQSALRENDPAAALERLGECDPALRGWEWHHVNNQCYDELLSFKGTEAVFSPDGSQIAVKHGRGAVVRDAWSGQEVLVLQGGPGRLGLKCLAFSPDGKWIIAQDEVAAGEQLLVPAVQSIASLAQPGPAALLAPVQAAGAWPEVVAQRIRLFDAHTGKEGPTFHGTFSCFHLRFHPDGKRILADNGGELHVLDASTGRQLFATTGATWALSPDGTRILVGRGQDANWLTVLDAGTGKEVRVIKGTNMVGNLMLTPDGKRVGVSSMNGAVRLFEVQTGREALAFSTTVPMPDLLCSPDGSCLIAVPWNQGRITAHDAKTGKELQHLKLPEHARSHPAFSPDGKLLAVAGFDGVVRLHDTHSGEEVLTFKAPVRLSRPIFSPDGTRVAAEGTDGLVRLYDAGLGSYPLTLPAKQVKQAVLSPDGERLITAGPRGDVSVIDLRTGQATALLRERLGLWVCAIDLDGTRFAVSPTVQAEKDDGLSQLYDARTGQPIMTLKGSVLGSVSSLRLGCLTSLTRSYVVTFGRDGTMWVYDAANGAPVGSFQRKKAYGVPIFSRNGERMADLGLDRVVRVYDLKTCKELISFRGPGQLFRPDLSPDGERIAFGSTDGAVHVHDTRTGQEVFTIKAEKYTLAGPFSPDGRRVAVSGEAGIRVYDSRTSQALFTLKGLGHVHRIHFSPDGERLVVEGDQFVKMYDGWTGQLSPLPKPPKGRPPVEMDLSANGQTLILRALDAFYLWEAPRDLEKHRSVKRQRLQTLVAGWHTAQLAEHEQNHSLWGAAFHLERLCRIEPTNIILHLRHGLALNKLGRTAAARRVFEKVLELNNLPPAVQALAHAELEHWEQASDLLARLVQMPNVPPSFWQAHALVRLQLDDQAGYSRICATMLSRFGAIPRPDIAYTVASTCAWAPKAAADPDLPVRMARSVVRANPANPDVRCTFGGLLYRAGKHQEAVNELKEALKLRSEGGTALDFLFLALAQQRLEQTDEARVSLERAAQAADTTPPESWEQRVQLRLLRREAEQGMPTSSASKTTAPGPSR